MSQFGVALRQVAQDRDVSIARLAKLSGIDRTTLHKFISGERTPKKSQAETLSSAMALLPHERERLLEAFEVSYYGDNVFYQRKQIQSIIENITNIHNMRYSVSELSNITTKSKPLHKAIECFSGEHAVNSIISEIIFDENQVINFSMPQDSPFFYSQLFTKYSVCDSLAINCFVAFSKQKNSPVNLNILANIMPFFVSHKAMFQAYYIYSDIDEIDLQTIPFPYFIQTSQFTLLLSSGLERAVLLQDEVFYGIYQQKCQDLMRSAKALLERICDPNLLLECYAKRLAGDMQLSGRGPDSLGIESQPCISIYLDKLTIRKYATSLISENYSIINRFSQYVAGIRARMQGQTSIFTKDGINSFANTGIIQSIPSNCVKPLDISDRIRLLRYMLNDTISNQINYRLMDSAQLSFPFGLSITCGCFSNSPIVFSDFQSDPDATAVIQIDEPSISGAFVDFFNYLPNSNFILSKDETVQAIEEALVILTA